MMTSLLACCHLLHLRKKQKNDDELGRFSVICIMPIYKLNKMSFQHTQETPANITSVVPFGQELVQMLYTSLPLSSLFCICQGVVTSPCTRRYNNDASSGDATSELTLEKKPKRWQRAGSLSTHYHLLHLKKKQRDDDKPRRFAIIC